MSDPTASEVIIACYGRAADDGDPICDDFACQTWACWCDRAPQPVCEHGIHPAECAGCEEANRAIDEAVLRRVRGEPE